MLKTTIITTLVALALFSVSAPAMAATIGNVSDSSIASSFTNWLISLFMTNNNNAEITNNVTSSANSGGNTFTSADDQANTEVFTGDASSATLVENSANNNMVGEEYEAADGSTDTITDVSDESIASASLNDTLDNQIENNNNVVVENNVDATADTGNNSVTSGDSLNDSKASTGIAGSVSGVSNLFNFNLNNIIRRLRSTIAP